MELRLPLEALERVEMRGEVEIDGLPERLGARVVTVFSEDKILQWAGEWKEIGMLKSMREKEARLIDAEKLKRHYAWWEGGSAEKTLDEAKRDFDEIVDLQPTAEITFEMAIDYLHSIGWLEEHDKQMMEMGRRMMDV